MIQTVLGPIEADAGGVTLMHEHVFINLLSIFSPVTESSLAGFVDRPVDMPMLRLLRRWPFSLCKDNVVLDDERLAIEELSLFAGAGGATLVDTTARGVGPDPVALARVSRATGVNIVQGTGIYVELTHPPWVAAQTVEGLAELFVRDVRDGIGDTGIRAGLVGEIGTSGVDPATRRKTGDVTEAEEKVLRAAALASVTTGAAVSVHLDPRGQGAMAAIDILESEGASPDRLVLAHLDSHPDLEYHLRVADRGVFVEYDHFGREYYAGHMDRPYTSDTRRIELLSALIERGYASQLLISHDICAKIDLAAFGGVGYDHILAAVLPRLRRTGIGADVIHQLLVDNPRRALSLPD